MKVFLQKHHRLLFYGIWLLLGLIQSRFTELQDDEAYYWVYAKFPAWGYFDHPPMIAILVKLGYAIFPNELGVRLFSLLLSTLSLVIIEKLIRQKNIFLFYAIVLSIAVLQVGGFMAAPDIPLLFFAALFFLCYRRFTVSQSFINILLLGISSALLFYCKYHAVLLIVFTLFSNPRLLKRYPIYLAGIIALALFLPHLYWQYQHNWVSLRYHLLESNRSSYRVSFTISYLLGQLLWAGPLACFVLLPAAFLYKPKDETERALSFTMIGIYLFFFLSSFRGKVETNWTSPVLISLIVLSHQFLQTEVKWRTWLLRLLPATLILVCFARIIMLVDILPVHILRFRFHSWDNWPAEMKQKTKGLPIVFNNSYQRASKYWFYTGQPVYSLNYYHARMNNYNYWPIEDSMLGKAVYYLDVRSPFAFPDSLKYPLGYVVYKYDSCYASFAKIKVEILPKKFTVTAGDSFALKCNFIIPPLYSSFIKEHPPINDTVRIGIFNSTRWVKDIFTSLKLSEINNTRHEEITVAPGLPKGSYYMLFAINTGIYTPTHNSEKIELVVK